MCYKLRNFIEIYFFSMDVKYQTTSKGNQSLLVSKFLYYHKRDNRASVNWICCHTPDCVATLTIDENNKIIKVNGIKIKTDIDEKLIRESHEHEPMSDTELAVAEAIDKIKKRVESEPTEVQQIIQQEQSKMARMVEDFNAFAIECPEFYTMQSGLYKRRRR